MPQRIHIAAEFMIGALTFASTLLWGEIAIKIITGIVTYFLARLLWWKFGSKIKNFLNRK